MQVEFLKPTEIDQLEAGYLASIAETTSSSGAILGEIFASRDLIVATALPARSGDAFTAVISRAIGSRSLQQTFVSFGAGASLPPGTDPQKSIDSLISSRSSSNPIQAKALPPNVERTWFALHQAELEANYLGRYVAVFGQQVVDSAVNMDALLERFLQTYAGGDFYIGFVGDEPPAAWAAWR
jgi:hypothetical protein